MPLSLEEEIRIVKDLEANGGRFAADFLQICNRDWNFYSEKKRRPYQRYVCNLKKKKIENYWNRNIRLFGGKLSVVMLSLPKQSQVSLMFVLQPLALFCPLL